MLSFSFWQRWLLIVSVSMAAFGVMMALMSGTALFAPFNSQIDPAFWGTGAVDAAARQFQQWLYGVWGATIAGMGMLAAFIAHHPFRNKERWAWQSLAAGVAVWFALDTLLSLIHRVYFNAAFNVAVLILVMLPLGMTRKRFA